MSLPIAYSSDEEESLAAASKDAFSLSSLPSTKRPRVEDATISRDAAPHVLAEVHSDILSFTTTDNLVGSIKSNIISDATDGYADERKHSI